MAVFSNMVLTNAGQVLYTKIQAGTEANFTRMQLGSGQLTEGQDATALTALITPAFYVPISSVVANSTLKVAQISALINNSGISTTTYICEIGLFAQDPDLGEILYGYANAGAQGDYFSPISEGAFSWSYQINAAIGNASSVTVNTSNVTNDYTLLNTNTFAIMAGDNQMAVNKNIDNILKPYTTTHSGNAYSVTIPDFDFADGYPICLKFDAASTGAITLNVNNSTAKAVVDYFGYQVTNVRTGLIANLRYDATNSNFQLLGKGGGGNTIPSHVLLNDTCTVNSGPIVGTMPNKSGASLGSGTPTGGTQGTGKFDFDILLPSNGYMDTTTKVHQTLTNLIPYNVVKGVNIPELGFTGTYDKIYGTGNVPTYAVANAPIPYKIDSNFIQFATYVTSMAPTMYSIYCCENYDSRIYKADLFGAVNWYVTGSGFVRATRDGSIIIAGSSSLNPSTGSTIRTYSGGVCALSEDKYLYTFTNSTTLVKINAQDGTTVWTVTVPAYSGVNNDLDDFIDIDNVNGYLYYCTGSSNIIRVSLSTGVYTTYSVSATVTSVKVDKQGNSLYVWNWANAYNIYKYTISSGAFSLAWTCTLPSYPYAVCTDLSGNYVYALINNGSNIIKTISASSGSILYSLQVGSSIMQAYTMRQDIQGNLYLGNNQNTYIQKIICSPNGTMILS